MQDANIRQLANEILNYLDEHPNATDTLEGITRWWFTELLYKRSRCDVEQAINYLITKEKLESIKVPGNQRLFKKRLKIR